MNIDISKINTIAIDAGDAITEVYLSGDFSIEQKSDNSPLTRADNASNKIITERLNELYPQIPVLSEEGKEIPFEERKNWEYFWLVDPLDGTKEFIKRNGECTVNIALIHKGIPVAGVIYAPALNLNDGSNSTKGVIYFSQKGLGSFKKDLKTGEQKQIHCSSNSAEEITIVKSRSHSSDEEEKFLSKFRIKSETAIGSSLKFCLIAEGKADLYYRHGPTMEWDTAAGQAILTEAGGKVIDLSGNEFIYNKQSLLNTSFIAFRNGLDITMKRN